MKLVSAHGCKLANPDKQKAYARAGRAWLRSRILRECHQKVAKAKREQEEQASGDDKAHWEQKLRSHWERDKNEHRADERRTFAEAAKETGSAVPGQPLEWQK